MLSGPGGDVHLGAQQFFSRRRGELLAFAAHQLRLAERQPDGATYRQHLEVAAKSGNRAASQELQGPECPPSCEHIWGWFLELHGARGSGFGVAPIGWESIEAFCRLNGWRMTPFEVECIVAIDHAYLSGEAKRASKKAGR